MVKIEIELGIFFFRYYDVSLYADYRYAKIKKFMSIAKAESLLLTSELNGHKKSFSGYSKKIKSLLANLKTLTNEFESISRLNSIKSNSIMLSAIRTHGRKFQQLLDDSPLHFDSPYITFLEYIERTPRSISPSIAGPLRDTKPHSKKKTTVVNMSNEHITNDELELLSLGLKFTPTPMNDPSTDIASRIQPTIRNLPNGMQSSIANDISHLLNPPSKRDNLQPHQRRALKNLKAKKQRLRILPTDKGNATVLLSHEQYHSKMTEHISSGPYTLLQRDPTSSLPGKVYRVLKKLLKEEKIDISVFNSCRNLHPRPPQLYGLPKIHKPNTPIRPIVSFYNTPLIALHKTLAHYIQPLTHSHLHIRDSKHMIHILHSSIYYNKYRPL